MADPGREDAQPSWLDPSIVASLPDIDKVLRVTEVARSAWARASRIDIRRQDGSDASYFMKVSTGNAGLDALKGEFESTSAIHQITPDFCPRPIACGTLASNPDSHFYVCRFYDFKEGLPDYATFCEDLARLHSSHTSPEGKFGFHCTTYNGDLPQENSWTDSWETFFDKGLRHVLRVREERAGPSEELNELLPALFDKVIPRLLRPLESHGRCIKPSLIHGDLWDGNTGVDAPTSKGIVFDPSSFWAHNEYELGNWRHKRSKFGQVYFEEYHSHIRMSEPVEDYDDRNGLYSLRFNLHAAALFPARSEFLKLAIDEIMRLAARYPDGYQRPGSENDNPPACLLNSQADTKR